MLLSVLRPCSYQVLATTDEIGKPTQLWLLVKRTRHCIISYSLWFSYTPVGDNVMNLTQQRTCDNQPDDSGKRHATNFMGPWKPLEKNRWNFLNIGCSGSVTQTRIVTSSAPDDVTMCVCMTSPLQSAWKKYSIDDSLHCLLCFRLNEDINKGCDAWIPYIIIWVLLV